MHEVLVGLGAGVGFSLGFWFMEYFTPFSLVPLIPIIEVFMYAIKHKTAYNQHVRRIEACWASLDRVRLAAVAYATRTRKPMIKDRTAVHCWIH